MESLYPNRRIPWPNSDSAASCRSQRSRSTDIFGDVSAYRRIAPGRGDGGFGRDDHAGGTSDFTRQSGADTGDCHPRRGVRGMADWMSTLLLIALLGVMVYSIRLAGF